MDESKKPHWAWPHVIGVLVTIIAYFVVYKFTGDSDLLIWFIALATGAGGMAATWAYFRYMWTPRA